MSKASGENKTHRAPIEIPVVPGPSADLIPAATPIGPWPHGHVPDDKHRFPLRRPLAAALAAASAAAVAASALAVIWPFGRNERAEGGVAPSAGGRAAAVHRLR